jgi:signal transduction histidine kinase
MNRLRGLPAQLFLFTVLPLTLLLVAIAFGGLSLHQRAMRQMVGERDQRAVRAAAATIEEQLALRSAIVENLALHAGHVSPATALKDMAVFHDQFIDLAIYGPDGELLAAGDPAFWNGPFQEADGTIAPGIHPASVSRPDATAPFRLLYSSPEARPILFVREITDSGIVAVGAFDPQALARDSLSRVVLPGDHAVAYLVAADGVVLYQTGSADHTHPVIEHPGVAEALRGEIGSTFSQIDGREYVASFTPVAPVGWALVMEEAWREMTDPMLRRTELAPFILLPVLAAALAGLWFGTRQIVRPLQALAARTTALGRGDFAAIREPVGGISEIRRLQDELAGMARRVQMAQQGLRDYLGALTTGQEEERRRLARELHDDTIQSLIALNQRIQLAQSRTAGLAPELAEMEAMTNEAIADLRRMTRDLRPSYLDDLGLVPALELLARDTSAALGIPVDFRSTGEARRLAPETELAFYRIAQEGLRNAGRHAGASQASLSLDFMSDRAMLTVADDGAGFDPAGHVVEAALTGHFGLLGARERAEAVGARLEIEAAPGKGTRLTVTTGEAAAIPGLQTEHFDCG